jgi:hypothetical protein
MIERKLKSSKAIGDIMLYPIGQFRGFAQIGGIENGMEGARRFRAYFCFGNIVLRILL